MKPHPLLATAILGAACFSLPAHSFALDQQLSLKHGIYVQAGSPCKGAPNAAILAWDGVGFSGAHSSKCTSRVSRKSEAQFEVETTCDALGDGSQSEATATDVFLLTRLSSSSFEILRKPQQSRRFRWCSAASVD